MRRKLPHGYTNDTVGDGNVVEKTYAGPDAEARLATEYAHLTELQGRLPVPPVLGRSDGTLQIRLMPGVPGQELLEGAHAPAVLEACGKILSRIHRTALKPYPAGAVLVHGDFGPNNLLLDPATAEVTAVVDWEFAHVGKPVEDLAWCEWIVRMHHPDQRPALPHFFDAYDGDVPAWAVRQAAMVSRCEELGRFAERWEPNGPAVALWRERTAKAAAWTE